MISFDPQKEVEALFPSYLKDLANLVSANSKNEEAIPGAPFGPGPKQALESMIAIADRMGYKTFVDPEGYYGYAEVGEGKEMLGVLGHLDVVPADDVENWTTPPFTMTQVGEELHGRGVQDDKGPMLASMYAMKILLDHGVVLNKRVRFIYCIDEETLWISVKAYAKKEEHPTYGFTPDADFPLLYAEMGLSEYTLTAQEADCALLEGGSALNAVPGKAHSPYTPELEEAMKSLGYEYKVDADQLVAIGKAMHVLDSAKGVNAITHLAEALVKTGAKGQALRFLTEKGNNPQGSNIFGLVSDFSGDLVFNPGLADFKPGKQSIGIDIRFPVTYKKEDVDAALEKAAAPYGLKVEQFDYLPSLHIPTDTPFIQKLMRAYQEVTGDTKTQPLTTGGATFARSMENIVAYGSLLPGGPDTEHQPNEYAIISQIKVGIQVYIRAFDLLAVEEE